MVRERVQLASHGHRPEHGRRAGTGEGAAQHGVDVPPRQVVLGGQHGDTVPLGLADERRGGLPPALDDDDGAAAGGRLGGQREYAGVRRIDADQQQKPAG